LKDFAVTNQKPNASSWLVPASVSLVLPGFFALALIVWGIKLAIKRVFNWPPPGPSSDAEEAQRNADNASTIVVIGADNVHAVISDRVGGKKDKVKIIDLKKLDLEASESMNSSKVCNICFAHRISVRFEPCGHAFTCSTCGEYFVGRPCGLCRRTVKSLEEFEAESSANDEEEDAGEESETATEASSRDAEERSSDQPASEESDSHSHSDSESSSDSRSGSKSEET
jgi:hypothetical protein